MKELSIEEKAKRYDEASKWMEGIYPTLTHEQQMEAEAFFPELKDSEDERIRKMLIEFFGWGAKNNCYTYNIPNKDILAWLEKQGQTYTKKDVDDAYLKGVTDTKKEIEKQYEANYQIRKNIATFLFYYRGDIKDRAKWMEYLGFNVSFVENQGGQKPQGKSALEAINEERVDNANKVEPKFKVGDWVVYTGYLLKDSGKEIYVMQVASVEDDRYNFTDTSTLCFDSEKDMRSWTIQDAKDGDVLAFDDETIVIFRDLYDAITFRSYCHIQEGAFSDSQDDLPAYWEGKDFHPATKDQRELLFKKMHEAGYEWDADKKELKQIEQKPADKVKPRYSIGDVLCDKSCTPLDKNSQPNIEILDIRNDMYICNNCTFPISQQDEYELVAKRIEPQPAWSEEDVAMLDDIIDFFENGTVKLQHDLSLYASWLKSLKDRVGCEVNCTTTWKPSDEQLDALQYVCRNLNPPLSDKLGQDSINILKLMYQDLKKLKS